ncbi:hypothetical protein ABI59_03745 [Acidobacteria bacterium Mor1]|nr:hypothetical protein ABI59_03745 [Acidobacteria bacterium Mor1]
MSRLPSTGGGLLFPFALLFILSGACGLTYEVVWSRHLVDVFGVTAFAVSTVLVSFMGGMALGAALLGPMADRSPRPLRMFALLEAGIGLYALVLPALMAGIEALYGALVPILPEALLLRSLLRFVLCLLLLLVPTVLMGGTLPALGRGLLARRKGLGAGVGLLYFVNTIGAALGCYLAGFELIPSLGLSRTTWLAAALNGVVALVAWFIDARTPDALTGDSEGKTKFAEQPGGTVEPATDPTWWPLAVACGSGMTALAFEVVWFRVLMLSFGSTVYSFSAMLAVFLSGLAVGSLVMGAVVDRVRSPVRLLALIQLAVAVLTLVAGMTVNRMPHLFLTVIQSAGFDLAGMNRTKLLLSLITLLPPALAFGATFPVAVSLYRGVPGQAGARIGRVYAWNTLGAIVGSFGAGFLLLPAIGAEWVMHLVVVAAAVLAFGTIVAERGPLRLSWAAPMALVVLGLVAGLVLSPRWDRTLLGAGVYFEPKRFLTDEGELAVDRVLADYRLINYTEGYNDTIISFRSPKGRFITVNGSATASSQFQDMLAQRMMGHIPMLLHPGKVQTAAVIGLGAGVTTGALAIHEVDRVVSVELEEGVRAGAEFFSEENHGVLDNPVVDLQIDDGRNYMKLTDERFDVISSHPNFPSLSGSGVLFNREFIELARDRLKPGGVMCHYAPLWRMRPVDVQAVVGTFVDVFPHVRVFLAGNSMILLGRADEPFPAVDLDELARRFAREPVGDSLREIGARSALEIASWYLFDTEAARAFAEGAPRSSDDLPYIEFNAPHGLFSETVGENLELIAGFRRDIETRMTQLGIDEPRREGFRQLAVANDRTRDLEVRLRRGESAGLPELMDLAADGQRYARYLAAGYTLEQAKALQGQSRFAEARDAFALALHNDPDQLDAMLGLGIVSLTLGRVEDAFQVLKSATERFPDSAGAWYRLGLVHEARGEVAVARDLYLRAVEAQPRLARPHALLGSALLREGRSSDAVEAFRHAMRLGESSQGVLIGLAEALISLGDHDAALDIARRATEAYPEGAAPWIVLSRAAEGAGRSEEAASARRQANSLSGGSTGG